MAKGFYQQRGLDYGETFNPAIKPATIRIAISRVWLICQLDVKNVFLHRVLSQTVFMKQPPGFVDPRRLSHVCKLHRAIYGLKHAPRAWFH